MIHSALLFLFTLIFCLAATILIEGALAALVFRRRNYVYYSVLCNLLTNPALQILLWLVANSSLGWPYYAVLFMLEITVVVIEGAVYRYVCGFSYAKALGLSLLFNAVSCGIGLLLFSF